MLVFFFYCIESRIVYCLWFCKICNEKKILKLYNCGLVYLGIDVNLKYIDCKMKFLCLLIE